MACACGKSGVVSRRRLRTEIGMYDAWSDPCRMLQIRNVRVETVC